MLRSDYNSDALEKAKSDDGRENGLKDFNAISAIDESAPITSSEEGVQVPPAKPELPPLPELPKPELCFEQMLAKTQEMIDAEIRPPRRKIKEQFQEWIESAAYYEDEELEELYDCLEELGITVRERERWLSRVKKKQKKVAKRIEKIEQKIAQIIREVNLHHGPMPAVIVNNRQLRIVADECMAHLKGNSKLYLYGGAIVRIGQNSEGRIETYVLDANSMPLTLSRAMDFFRESKYDYVAVLPPDPVTKAVLNHDKKELPPLKGLTYTPILTERGIEYQRGYLPYSHFYNACEFDVAQWALNPTFDDVKRAIQLLNDTFAEFRFVKQADRANTYAMAIQQIARPYINDICPLFGIQATTEGTGKTYLAECAAYISIPANINPIIQAPKNEEEWRKQITTFMQSGKPFMIFDNVDGYLNSPSLTRLITTLTWADRLLGANRQVEIPVTQTLALTANNVRLHKDILSRTIFINLDANMEKPWLRKFKRDIKQEIRHNRKPYVDALVALAAWWDKQGRPLKTPLITRFKRWEAIIGGILQAAGIEGFCANVGHQESDELVAWRAFVTWWRRRYGTTEVTAHDLLSGASHHDSRPDEGQYLLAQWIGLRSEQGRLVKLGYLLKRFNGRVFNDYKIVQTDVNERGTFYRLVKR